MVDQIGEQTRPKKNTRRTFRKREKLRQKGLKAWTIIWVSDGTTGRLRGFRGIQGGGCLPQFKKPGGKEGLRQAVVEMWLRTRFPTNSTQKNLEKTQEEPICFAKI